MLGGLLLRFGLGFRAFFVGFHLFLGGLVGIFLGLFVIDDRLAAVFGDAGFLSWAGWDPANG